MGNYSCRLVAYLTAKRGLTKMTTKPVIEAATKEESEYIRRRLIEYNAQHVPEHLRNRYEEINLTVKDEDGRVVGGMLAEFCWNWIEVHILWVDDAVRRSGYGSKLLQQIETIAREKECNFLKLNTFSFQAPEFYKKKGYREIAVLEDAPSGSRHYYFKKDIV